MYRFSFLVGFIFLVNLITAQDQRIVEINNQMTRIDQKSRESAFKESSFEDDYGNETDIKAFFKEGKLLKIVAASRSLKGTTMKSYYFSNAELILVHELILEHPGLANWEEAKSNDLGEEEITRVQNVVTKEKRYYLDGLEVIKSLPKEISNPREWGKILSLEARDLLGRLQ